MARREKLFAGGRLRAVRERLGQTQGAFAARLGLSVSYLSQIETDRRPITMDLLLALNREFGIDLAGFSQDEGSRLASDVQEALADPLFAGTVPGLQEIKRAATGTPGVAHALVALHRAYRAQAARIETMDEAIDARASDGGVLPWEEVRDWFHYRDNYVGELDEAAEALVAPIETPAVAIEALLGERHGIAVRAGASGTMRRFDAATRTVAIDDSLDPASRSFLLAHQLALVEFAEIIGGIAGEAALRSDAARSILRVGLANYAAGALLMPYGRFIAAARAERHDVERLQRQFATSFEQVCHRLSNLQRPGARGVPFFFVRVDMAGNITKRHSATRLQFARYGGACPLWVVHEAVALPGRIMVQLAEMPDGARYVSMARGLVKRAGAFDRPDRRYAVALGCEIGDAAQFVYADALARTAPTPIGTSCRICPREDCAQRAFPPADRGIVVDIDARGVVPYRFT
jgi:predicted transcriptional regulator/transcriptional regulator with XRE-family HTH domain